MKDIGVDRRNNMDDKKTVEEESGLYYPGLQLNDASVPALAGKDVGDIVKLEIEIKILGKRLPEDYDEVHKGNYFSTEVRKIGEPA